MVEYASLADEAQLQQQEEQLESCEQAEQQLASLGIAGHFLSLQQLLQQYKHNSQQIQPNTDIDVEMISGHRRSPLQYNLHHELIKI